MTAIIRSCALALCLACAADRAGAQTLSAPPPPPPIGTPSAPAPFAFGRPIETAGAALVLRDAHFTLGPATLRAPRVEILGSTLGAGEIAALLAQEGDAPERPKRFDAALVAMPEAIVEMDAGALRQTTVYRDVLLRGVAQGRIGEASAASATIEAKSPESPLAATMTGVTSEDVEVGAGLRLLIGPAAPGAGAATIFKRFAVARYTAATRDGSTEIRNFSASGLRLANLGAPLFDLGARLAEIRRDAPIRDFTQILAVARNILTAVELDAARFGFIGVEPATGKTKVQFERAWLRDMRGGRFSIGVDAARIADDVSTTTIAGFELTDYDQIGVLDALARVAPDPEGIDRINPALLIPNFRRVALASVLSCKSQLADCEADAADVTVKDAELERVPVGGGLDWRFKIKSFRIPASGDARAWDGSVSGDVAWRPQAKTLSLREAALHLAGYGEARATLDAENVLPEAFTAPSPALVLALMPAAVKRFAFRLVDAGGVDRIAEQEARKTHAAKGQAGAKGKREARNLLAARIERDLAEAGDAPRAAKALIGAFGGFVRDPGRPLSVTIVAQPSIGALDIAALRNANALLRRLTVTSERR